MDFSSILRLKNKQSVWMDVAFYLAVSVLVAVVFCYFIFSVRIYMQKNQIADYKIKIEEVGTEEQKQYETEIIAYQKRIKDYLIIIKEHEFSSNAFSLLEKLTLPNVWFNKFSMIAKNDSVALTGETDSMESLSKQISYFEKSEYIEKISLLNSTMQMNGKLGFNLNIVLKPELLLASTIVPVKEETENIDENEEVVNEAVDNENSQIETQE